MFGIVFLITLIIINLKSTTSLEGNLIINKINKKLIKQNGLCYEIIIILDSNYWSKSAEQEIKESLSYKWNENIAKNVIIFIGDGMSIDTITASRIYHKGEANYLGWEKFPHIGLIKVRI